MKARFRERLRSYCLLIAFLLVWAALTMYASEVLGGWLGLPGVSVVIGWILSDVLKRNAERNDAGNDMAALPRNNATKPWNPGQLRRLEHCGWLLRSRCRERVFSPAFEDLFENAVASIRHAERPLARYHITICFTMNVVILWGDCLRVTAIEGSVQTVKRLLAVK